MWLHKSRSISKRERRGNMGIIDFGKKFLWESSFGQNIVVLSNKEININKEKLFENQGIDINESFNYKLSLPKLDIGIFKIPLIDNRDNDLIYIGIQDYRVVNDILWIEKDNNCRYYVLLPYFKVDKDNLEEGKYINAHTKLSYHLGLFEMQVSRKQERDDNKILIRKLESLNLIETISIKNELTFDEFFNDYYTFNFLGKPHVYILSYRSFGTGNYLMNNLTNSVYFFDIFYKKPKIGTICFDKDVFEKVYYNRCRYSCFMFYKGRWFFQIRLDGRHIIKDNCNGKYEKVKMFKYKNYLEYDYLFRYNKFKSPYFDYWSKEDSDLEKYDNLVFDGSKKLNHLSFSRLNGRYIRFQFTPFNNLNLVYYNKYQNEYFGTYLYEYSMVNSMVTIDKHRITALKLNNEKNIISKYKLNDKYKNKYHRYLYYLDDNKRPPYIQVWKARKTQQTYGIILNMKGKRGVFDKEIIVEK